MSLQLLSSIVPPPLSTESLPPSTLQALFPLFPLAFFSLVPTTKALTSDDHLPLSTLLLLSPQLSTKFSQPSSTTFQLQQCAC